MWSGTIRSGTVRSGAMRIETVRRRWSGSMRNRCGADHTLGDICSGLNARPRNELVKVLANDRAEAQKVRALLLT